MTTDEPRVCGHFGVDLAPLCRAQTIPAERTYHGPSTITSQASEAALGACSSTATPACVS